MAGAEVCLMSSLLMQQLMGLVGNVVFRRFIWFVIGEVSSDVQRFVCRGQLEDLDAPLS